jgi:hypothetical protein
MVTKGYRKGVYDRVTEGTWETARIGKVSEHVHFTVTQFNHQNLYGEGKPSRTGKDICRS